MLGGVPQNDAAATCRLANAISSDLVDEVSRSLSRNGAKKKVHGHYWCSVIAAICQVYDEAFQAAKKDLDAGVDLVMDALGAWTDGTNSGRGTIARVVERSTRGGGPVGFEGFEASLVDDILRQLVKKALGAIIDSVSHLGEEMVMKYVRIIGAIVCPDPARHPAVVRYCIWPLIIGPLKGVIASDLRDWIAIEYLGRRPEWFAGSKPSGGPGIAPEFNRDQPPPSSRLVATEEAIFPSETKEIADDRG